MKKFVLIWAALAIIFGGLAVFSTNYSVTRIENAIDNLGEITYDQECRDKIETIIEYYDALDPNQNLEAKISNADTFTQAKATYASYLIKAASLADSRKDIEGYTNEEVAEFVTDARDTIDLWLTEDELELVDNYDELAGLEATYCPAEGGGAASAEEEVQIQLCP